jgi:ABC-2 type transport system ATP-binding protein
MSDAVIEATGLSKHYGKNAALDNVSFKIAPGRIVALIGRNGAGKTTALKSILGLTHYEGQLQVLGMNPATDRDALMQQVCFIADVAVLPRWLRVQQALDFVAAVQPRFNRERAREYLAKTSLKLRSRVGELSKGLVTQLHLALILAIDARLLVLDEPTLGLDLLNRRQFYDTLLNDYFDHERTILLTTHQVEEVENLVSDVLFIDDGKILLDCSVEQIAERFQQLLANPDQLAAARALRPFGERQFFGKTVLFFEGQDTAQLAALGEVSTPQIADLFVARVQGVA